MPLIQAGFRIICDGCGATEEVTRLRDRKTHRVYASEKHQESSGSRAIGKGWLCDACFEAFRRYVPEAPSAPRTAKRPRNSGSVQVQVHQQNGGE